MRKLVPLLLIALALGLVQVQNRVDLLERPSVSLIQIIEWVEPSVVYIEASNYEGIKLWSGSGVIISSDGLVLTAAHVVDGAEKFKVILPDGREFLSEDFWHKHEISDVGFIQLDVSEKLPVSRIGKSNNLKKGEDIFVVGCPFGYGLRFTVTKGIVSGLERDREGFFGEKFLLQVDAQSWPGNSGGPVYDMDGKIVGILVGGFYGADGIGLCIPADVITGLLYMYESEQFMEKVK
jgi:S1-C subfamily serine protease